MRNASFSLGAGGMSEMNSKIELDMRTRSTTNLSGKK